jgi:hypothetical protein
MTDRPLLLLDIDGVLNPFAAPGCPDGYAELVLFAGEEPVRVNPGHGGWLRERDTPPIGVARHRGHLRAVTLCSSDAGADPWHRRYHKSAGRHASGQTTT